MYYLLPIVAHLLQYSSMSCGWGEAHRMRCENGKQWIGWDTGMLLTVFHVRTQEAFQRSTWHRVQWNTIHEWVRRRRSWVKVRKVSASSVNIRWTEVRCTALSLRFGTNCITIGQYKYHQSFNVIYRLQWPCANVGQHWSSFSVSSRISCRGFSRWEYSAHDSERLANGYYQVGIFKRVNGSPRG